LESDLGPIREQGIVFKTGIRIGDDTKVGDLKMSHDAVFLAIGAPRSRDLDIEGKELEGVLCGLEFLQKTNAGTAPRLKGDVVVVGGDNVALHVARSALRLGATTVRLACLETRQQMPAHDRECDHAVEEGVVVHASWGPKRILGENGKVIGVQLKRCTSCFDKEGAYCPEYDESTTDNLACSTILVAVGRSPDLALLDGTGVRVHPDGSIRVNPETLETDEVGIFAGGDVTTMPGSVVEAVAAGRRAASSMDRLLGGDGNIDEKLAFMDPPTPRLGREKGFSGRSRVAPTCLEPESRKGSFSEVASTLDREAVVREARRCLQCDLRLRIRGVALPPEKWQVFSAKTIESVPEAEGVYILLDGEKKIFVIKGVQNLRKALGQELKKYKKARFFDFEQSRMYTQRETELLQLYGLTGGSDDLY
jgi:NADPH-dependent glutamate synthase beta subunit-like oxidoreductase